MPEKAQTPDGNIIFLSFLTSFMRPSPFERIRLVPGIFMGTVPSALLYIIQIQCMRCDRPSKVFLNHMFKDVDEFFCPHGIPYFLVWFPEYCNLALLLLNSHLLTTSILQSIVEALEILAERCTVIFASATQSRTQQWWWIFLLSSPLQCTGRLENSSKSL